MAIWSRDNKIIVDANGKVIVCNECPCGSIECREAVDNEVTRLLNLVDEHGHSAVQLRRMAL